MKSGLITVIRKQIPEATRLRLRRKLYRWRHPAFLGTLRRTRPLSRHWGMERGQPVDRYYIEQFLADYQADIRGNVLEIKDSGYTDRYGQAVSKRDVLDIDAANAQATFVTDLSKADGLPSNYFDCFIITQTLQFIFDIQAAICHSHRILRPGGVMLATVPCASQIDGALAAIDYWRFTVASCKELFGEVFGPANVTVQSRGNVLTNIAFLSGMAVEELSKRELETSDPQFPLVITVRAVKAKVG